MAFLFSAGYVTAAAACELKLLLTWDVSPSMSPQEYHLQSHGTARAFIDPAVQRAISLMPGGVAVSILQWAGPEEQVVSLPWTLLCGGTDVQNMALKAAALADPYDSFTGTAVGDSLRAAAAHLEAGPDCDRTVLDISSDRVANSGIPAGPEAMALIAAGVEVNALLLPASELALAAEGDPFVFYLNEIARSPASFVMEVVAYETYWQALRMKLLRELTPYVARN